MRTFDLGCILLEETFEEYTDVDDLTATWTLTDAGSIATLALCDDPYSSLGQRRHVALTLNNTTGSEQTVTLQSAALRGYGLYTPSEANGNPGFEFGFRYRAEASLTGISVGYSSSHSAFGSSGSAAATCDDTWRQFTDTGNLAVESVLASGNRLIVTVPTGLSGVVRLDDYIVSRTSQLARVIDSSCPVAFMRMDWDAGIEEGFEYLTDVYTADDGTEQRQTLRAFPRVTLRYTTLQVDARETARTDAWLYANHGVRVAVPRWMDAIQLGVNLSPGAFQIFLAEDMDERWFAPYQRIMLWESPARWEAVEIEQTFSSQLIQLDVNVNTVAQAWTAGSTLVVPLVPARLANEMTEARESKRSGRIPLTFVLDAA